MDPTVIRTLQALQDLKVAELKKRYRELFGEESKSSNKQFLYRRIAFRLQANEEGDLSERARRRATEIADDRDLRVRAPKEFRLAWIPVPVSTIAPGLLWIAGCLDRAHC